MPRLIRRCWGLVIGLLIGGGFYLLLIDTASLPELYLLAGVALACGVAFELAHEQGFVEAGIAPWWLLRIWRLVLKIPVDVAFVCGEAVTQLFAPKPTRGVFRATAFAHTEATKEATGRRALTDTLGSVAPNTIVIGVDTERGLLLVHQLHRTGPPEDLDVLRLG